MNHDKQLNLDFGDDDLPPPENGDAVLDDPFLDEFAEVGQAPAGGYRPPAGDEEHHEA